MVDCYILLKIYIGLSGAFQKFMTTIMSCIHFYIHINGALLDWRSRLTAGGVTVLCP